MKSSLYAITFDCGDAGGLAQFWSEVFGRPVDADATSDFASIGLNDDASAEPRLMFVKVPEGKVVKNRVHLDLGCADLDVEVKRLVSLGAQQGAEFTEGGGRWITLADPEGNEFDVLAEQ